MIGVMGGEIEKEMRLMIGDRGNVWIWKKNSKF